MRYDDFWVCSIIFHVCVISLCVSMNRATCLCVSMNRACLSLALVTYLNLSATPFLLLPPLDILFMLILVLTKNKKGQVQRTCCGRFGIRLLIAVYHFDRTYHNTPLSFVLKIFPNSSCVFLVSNRDFFCLQISIRRKTLKTCLIFHWTFANYPCTCHCIKSVRIWGYSGPHFPAFGLNKERYRISPYSFQMWKNADQNNSEYGHFSRSAYR